MGVIVSEITSPFWSQSTDVPGGIVAGIEDIKQCIFLIMGTQLGSDPFRHSFGSKVYDYVDEPVIVAAPKIARAAKAAIQLWEPRVTVKDVTFVYGTDGMPIFTIEIKVKPEVNLATDTKGTFFMGFMFNESFLTFI